VAERCEELGSLLEKTLDLFRPLCHTQLEGLVARLQLFRHLVHAARELAELVRREDGRSRLELPATERSVRLDQRTHLGEDLSRQEVADRDDADHRRENDGGQP
jgi:hypothetical protein